MKMMIFEKTWNYMGNMSNMDDNLVEGWCLVG